MQKQLPVSFSISSDWGRGQETRNDLIMISAETSRSGKKVIRARGHWEGDLHTIVKDVPPTPEFDPKADQNQSNYSMAACHYFWDWLRYGAVLAILEIALEDHINYDDICYFRDMLDLPKFQPGKYVFTDYFGKLEVFAKSVKLKFQDNRFSDITMKWK